MGECVCVHHINRSGPNLTVIHLEKTNCGCWSGLAGQEGKRKWKTGAAPGYKPRKTNAKSFPAESEIRNNIQSSGKTRVFVGTVFLADTGGAVFNLAVLFWRLTVFHFLAVSSLRFPVLANLPVFFSTVWNVAVLFRRFPVLQNFKILWYFKTYYSSLLVGTNIIYWWTL